LHRALSRVAVGRRHGTVAAVGGHDIVKILEAFAEARRHAGQPCVMLAQTIKGWGLPMAGDPMNHGALLTATQMEALRDSLGIESGAEWERFPDSSPEGKWIRARPAPFRSPARRVEAPELPEALEESYPETSSGQERFGRALSRLARLPVGAHVVTLSADVAVTTHLGARITR